MNRRRMASVLLLALGLYWIVTGFLLHDLGRVLGGFACLQAVLAAALAPLHPPRTKPR